MKLFESHNEASDSSVQEHVVYDPSLTIFSSLPSYLRPSTYVYALVRDSFHIQNQLNRVLT